MSKIKESIETKHECKNCEELKLKVLDLENSYKRALADYTNLSKRYDEDKIKIISFANEILITKMLGVLDDLEESQKHVKSDGIDMVIQKFKKVLTEAGITELNPINEIFDPISHEALDLVNGEKDKIIIVNRKGYLLSDKVIRPALVSVGNGNS
ncbi:nucleotide exchange factor GrpE [candidate division WWE3 bacterium CG_4_9_14_0_2_um_filter_35_11]|uniref:Protein GrpE n=1 Tax=candidate division WWE3 bacterium CG_4_9_14_0_2_um_filter_35_11 TaxID=1975077 RepID=A0A2M8EM33_UNCKA|nr:MAG: nucleotide exchange factor GrpE [candidate division WWE3 bacterium CG10_big_fil_rev_8_21_14_0_10_35_32]PJC23791.1 MAG: nucleotide exchange factor GrpE [candidate division WWE3 bacterium CG_4_9_14_0_2_um_filter_35_11]